jgi:polar amino acid transport system permease protein
MSFGGGARLATQADLSRIGNPAPDQVVAAMRAAQARRSLRFRVIFVATWVVIVGALILTLEAGRFDPGFLSTWWLYILGGATTTLFVSVCSIILAVLIAVFGALGRLSLNPVLYGVASLYVSLVRGTPLLVQIFFVYLALPQVIPATADIPLVVLGIFALAFNYGAYLTEIFRAGIQAVPRGQREAGEALGMPERLIMRRIVLPQAVRIVIPAIGNDFIAMTKDSALVSVIGVPELLWRAQRIGSANFRNTETLLLAAAAYWVITMVLSFFQERLERRLARGDR